MWSKSNIAVGDLILVRGDEEWGAVRSLADEGPMAYYASNDQNYLIVWGDIEQVTRNGNRVDPSNPLPVAPSAAPVTAMTVTADLNAQRKIEPGHIVTWQLARRNGYDDNRLFVILNFTKNSNKTMVNIVPLNGVQPGEGRGAMENLGWYKVQVRNVAPVAFPAPLIKRKAGK